MDETKKLVNNLEISVFVNFLKTGELGPIKLGLKVEEVLTILGKPKNSYRPFKGTEQDHLLNFQYNNLMMTFYDDALNIYIIQFQNGLKAVRGGLPPQLNVNWFLRVKKMTFDEFIDLVKARNLNSYKLITDEKEGQLVKFPRSGVEVNFDLGIRNGIYQIDCSKIGPDNRQFEELI
jgi:hypothetical protein